MPLRMTKTRPWIARFAALKLAAGVSAQSSSATASPSPSSSVTRTMSYSRSPSVSSSVTRTASATASPSTSGSATLSSSPSPSPSTGFNFVRNYNFETMPVGTSWSSSNVDWYCGVNWVDAYSGTCYVDMSGGTAGMIYQDLVGPLEAGRRYVVRAAVSGNWNCACPGTRATIVYVNTTSIGQFSRNGPPSGWAHGSVATMFWEIQELTFTAAASGFITLKFVSQDYSNAGVFLDDVMIGHAPSATTTPSVSASTSPSRSVSASTSPSRSVSSSVSASASESRSASASRSASPSGTLSASVSASSTSSWSVTRSRSVTPSVTASSSSSPSRSSTESRTATVTASRSRSPSVSGSLTRSPSLTPSGTASASITLSATPSPSPTFGLNYLRNPSFEENFPSLAGWTWSNLDIMYSYTDAADGLVFLDMSAGTAGYLENTVPVGPFQGGTRYAVSAMITGNYNCACGGPRTTRVKVNGQVIGQFYMSGQPSGWSHGSYDTMSWRLQTIEFTLVNTSYVTLRLESLDYTNAGIFIDSIALGLPPSPTPSVSPSRTTSASATISQSVSASVTASRSVSPSRSVSATLTSSSSASLTVSRSVTASKSVSSSVSSSISGSRTTTPSVSASITGSASVPATRTASSSVSPSRSASQSRSASISSSGTVSPSVSSTETASSSVTASSTGSSSITASSTASSSVTPSDTPSPSVSGSNGPTPSVTASLTPSPSISPSIAASPSVSPSNPPSPSVSQSNPMTPSHSPSGSASSSVLATGTPSASASTSATESTTGSATSSASRSASGTASSTATASGTASSSSSASVTASSTASSSGSPSFGSSSAATVSTTVSPSASKAASLSPSASASATLSSSRTRTGSVTSSGSASRSVSPSPSRSASIAASDAGSASITATASATASLSFAVQRTTVSLATISFPIGIAGPGLCAQTMAAALLDPSTGLIASLRRDFVLAMGVLEKDAKVSSATVCNSTVITIAEDDAVNLQPLGLDDSNAAAWALLQASSASALPAPARRLRSSAELHVRSEVEEAALSVLRSEQQLHSGRLLQSSGVSSGDTCTRASAALSTKSTLDIAVSVTLPASNVSGAFSRFSDVLAGPGSDADAGALAPSSPTELLAVCVGNGTDLGNRTDGGSGNGTAIGSNSTGSAGASAPPAGASAPPQTFGSEFLNRVAVSVGLPVDALVGGVSVAAANSSVVVRDVIIELIDLAKQAAGQGSPSPTPFPFAGQHVVGTDTIVGAIVGSLLAIAALGALFIGLAHPARARSLLLCSPRRPAASTVEITFAEASPGAEGSTAPGPHRADGGAAAAVPCAPDAAGTVVSAADVEVALPGEVHSDVPQLQAAGAKGSAATASAAPAFEAPLLPARTELALAAEPPSVDPVAAADAADGLPEPTAPAAADPVGPAAGANNAAAVAAAAATQTHPCAPSTAVHASAAAAPPLPSAASLSGHGGVQLVCLWRSPAGASSVCGSRGMMAVAGERLPSPWL